MTNPARHAAAHSLAQPILASLCAKKGYEIPSLKIVDALPGGDTGTACASSVRGAGAIDLPYAVTEKLSPDGLESLLGHELGHIIQKKSPTMLSRHAMFGLFVILAVATLPIIAVGVLTQADALYLILPGVLFTLALLSLVVTMTISQKNESECDVFSYKLTKNLPGALEHLNSYITGGKDHHRKRGLWLSLMSHHPTPSHRITVILKAARIEALEN